MAEEEKNKSEEAIKDACQRRAVKQGMKVAKFLEKVALNDNYRGTIFVKVKDPETGEYSMEEQKCPVSTSVRVSAARTWKEMIMDKAIGDIKEKAKQSATKGLNMKAALEAVAKAQRKEEAETPVEEEEL